MALAAASASAIFHGGVDSLNHVAGTHAARVTGCGQHDANRRIRLPFQTCAGEFTGGEREVEDVDAAVRHGRSLAPALPLGLVGYSFGARMSADWLERGGRADAVVLVALPLRDPEQGPLPPPRLPAGTFVVAAEDDQFGKADELRAALPDARLAVVPDAEHFFIGKRDEVLPVQIEVQREIDAAHGAPLAMGSVERFAFYELAKKSYCIIQTGERRFYGNFVIRKGVIPPDVA